MTVGLVCSIGCSSGLVFSASVSILALTTKFAVIYFSFGLCGSSSSLEIISQFLYEV